MCILCPVTLQFLLLTGVECIPSTPLNFEFSHVTCLGQWIFIVCLLYDNNFIIIFIYLFYLKNLFIYFIYLFLAALGLHCCARVFSSCGERGLHFVVVHRLLIEMASLCWGARALGARTSVVVAHGLSSCGTRAQ